MDILSLHSEVMRLNHTIGIIQRYVRILSLSHMVGIILGDCSVSFKYDVSIGLWGHVVLISIIVCDSYEIGWA